MLSSRRVRHDVVSASLAARDEEQLAALVDAAATRGVGAGVGVGGGASVLDVDGMPVFAKRIPITERELAHPLSTADLFDLPLFCRYGLHRVAVPGVNAWRELAANQTVTEAVLEGEPESFAMLHHWRVLPGRPPVAPEHQDIDAVVARLEGDPAVRTRLEEMARASSSLVLFLEHVPDSLLDRLDTTEEGIERVEQQLFAVVDALRHRQLLHLDGHFANLRADDDRIYLVDFGWPPRPGSPCPRPSVTSRSATSTTTPTTRRCGWSTGWSPRPAGSRARPPAAPPSATPTSVAARRDTSRRACHGRRRASLPGTPPLRPG